ncbi:MAG TPA: PepSY-associated TM helix domain-containing protein [Chitinophaga sp.]|uniref:PepSY-associated TM helix domain-containing protein n=1 Tax=Chitinophaga sp. TaxID=1869181 RepID=UPI002C58C0E2|nr:PepSY-associated TM helix domain-containing protein [Chitinophaga sp.]HVI49507.1 PepSY-associated TM helix domain-containing protein [Chitinophaga sp.]
MTVKQITGKLHLWLGLASGLVVLVVALTGSILVFEQEIDLWLNRDVLTTTHIHAQRKSLDELTAAVQQRVIGKEIQRIQVFQEPNRNALFMTSDKKPDGRIIVAVNPYTAEVAGVYSYDKRFFTIVLQLHRYLLMGETGKLITGISCIIFLLMLVSGMVLWWPRVKQAVKQRFRVKWNASFKRLNWDLHAVLGFYAFLFLFVIAATGLVWSYPWVNKMLFLLADGKPQQKEVVKNDPASVRGVNGKMEKMLTALNATYTFPGDINIFIPAERTTAVMFSKENKKAHIDNVVSAMYFDRNSGAALKVKPYEQESNGSKLRRLVYPVHTGSVYGWPTQILALLVSLFAASLPVTGTIIWLGRRKKKKPAINKIKPVNAPAYKGLELAGQ